MTVQPDQADPKYKRNHMTYRSCVQLPLVVDGVDDIIDSKILGKTILLVHLADLGHGINPDIVTLNKERGDIFSEYCTKRFKESSYIMSMKYYF